MQFRQKFKKKKPPRRGRKRRRVEESDESEESDEEQQEEKSEERPRRSTQKVCFLLPKVTFLRSCTEVHRLRRRRGGRRAKRGV